MSAPDITIDQVSVRFGDLVAVDRASATLPAGSFSAVIGPNGCGKSTLLRALCRVHPADEGTFRLAGRDIASLGRRELARTVSLLPQATLAPPGLSVEELVQRGRHPHQSLFAQRSAADVEAVERAVQRAGIVDLLPRRVGELSGGQRQRAWLAMVLAQDTPVVLLDEPTTYLDLAAQYHLLDLCAELVDEGRTVVTVLHDLPQAASYADHVVLMKAGRVVAEGGPASVVTAERVEDVYGIACRVDLDDPRGPVVVPLSRHHRRDVTGA